MNKTSATVLMIKGAITELPIEEQDKTHEIASELREKIEAFPLAATMAVALIGAELQAIDSQDL